MEHDDIHELFAMHEQKDKDRFATIDVALADMNKKLDKILGLYEGMGFIGRSLIKTGALAGSIAAIIFLIVQIKNFFK